MKNKHKTKEFPSYGNQYQKQNSYLPQLAAEEILLKLSPYALSSLDLQYEPQDLLKFHPEPLYDLLYLHIKLKLS